MAESSLNIALAQLNPTVGDLEGNVALILEARKRARAEGADLVVTPELCLTGYPPEDLILKPDFLLAADRHFMRLLEATQDGGPGLLVGAPVVNKKKEGRAFHLAFSPKGSPVFNAAVLIDKGVLVGWRAKHVLCDYGVFDERRVFDSGPLAGPLAFRGVRLGVFICADMWRSDVCETLAETGAQILVCLNGSPFHFGKDDVRLQHAVQRVQETALPLVYVNMVGGQDDIVFDGGSFVLNGDCSLAARAPEFQETIFHCTFEHSAKNRCWRCVAGDIFPPLDRLASIYQALVAGLQDYVRKNGFPAVLIGMSGGIDSALSAAIAVDALGPEKVRLVMMPSRYTSQASLDDAALASKMLGAQYDIVPIRPAVAAFEEMLEPLMAGQEADIAEENIQARSRGLVLMALSNKSGAMVLSTGNKSEMSVGYATLYGDMCGGFNALKDVYKTTVFDLARWRNENKPATALGPDGPVIPEDIITKPPSAELRPHQKDQDSLPDYAVLDAILEALIEREESLTEILSQGYDETLVRRVSCMLDLAEYKRRQSAPGVKITQRDLARDRRYPITNRYRG